MPNHYLPAYSALSSLVYPFPGESHTQWADRLPARIGTAVPGTTLMDLIHEGDTQGMLVSDDRTYTLVFRGTEKTSINDLLVDLRAWPMEVGCNLAVHSGAWASLEAIWPQIEKILHQLDKPLNLVGHSLGGMLASHAAFRMLKRSRKPVALHHLATFGSPAPGNREFSSMLCAVFNGTMRRVVRCSDIVPRLKTLWMLGYRQPDCVTYIDANKLVWTNPSRSFRMWDRLFFISHSLSDHSHVEYARILKEYYAAAGPAAP